jgi:hypothetical protein
MMTSSVARPDFEGLAADRRTHMPSERRVTGHVPTIAHAPMADGRTSAYKTNVEKTWRMSLKVYDLAANGGPPTRSHAGPIRSCDEMINYLDTGGVHRRVPCSPGISGSPETEKRETGTFRPSGERNGLLAETAVAVPWPSPEAVAPRGFSFGGA